MLKTFLKNPGLTAIYLANTILMFAPKTVYAAWSIDTISPPDEIANGNLLDPGSTVEETKDAVINSGNEAISTINTIVNIAIGIFAIWQILSFIKNIVDFVRFGDNPRERVESQKKFTYNLIAIGILGGIYTVISLALNLFR